MKIPIFKLQFENKFINLFQKNSKKILLSNALSEGLFVAKFENKFKNFVKSKFAIAVSSGTSALETAFRAINIKNKEVIIPTNTFFGTSIPITRAGGTFVLCDQEKNGIGLVSDEGNHEDEEVEKIVLPVNEEVYEKFLNIVPLEKKERTEEDLEVFLVDFKPPNIKKWDSGMVKHFFGEWFIKNANPLKEDIESMRESLLSLFQFLDREELLHEGFFDQVSAFLEK